MTTVPYDFRSPPPADAERRVAAWAEEACRRLRTTWAAAVPFPVTFDSGMTKLITAKAAAAHGPADGFAVLCRTSAPVASLLFGLPAAFVRGAIAGLLGETPASPPETDRALSSLERPLFDYVARDLLAAVWTRAWPDPNGPTLSVADLGPARTVWRPPADMAILVSLTATTPFGTYDCPVLLPRGEWTAWARPAATIPTPARLTADRGRIETLVRGMRVDLTVELGTAEVTLQELSKLRVGDLIVLSQKVTDPLAAHVGGEEKLSVWPGLVGTRHAIQVRAVTAADEGPKG